MEFIKNTSFGIHHRIRNEDGGIAAEAHDIIVTYDFNKNEKVPVSDEFKHAVARIEQTGIR